MADFSLQRVPFSRLGSCQQLSKGTDWNLKILIESYSQTEESEFVCQKNTDENAEMLTVDSCESTPFDILKSALNDSRKLNSITGLPSVEFLNGLEEEIRDLGITDTKLSVKTKLIF